MNWLSTIIYQTFKKDIYEIKSFNFISTSVF